MTREEHLVFCKQCSNRKMDLQKGLVCGLTGDLANFEGECKDYIKEETAPTYIPADDTNEHQEVIELPADWRAKLAPHQDIIYAIIGGIFLSILSSLIWAAITVSTQYQIGYMAIGVGFLVGFGVRYFGAGIDYIFGILGGILALIGCLLGNLFSQIGFYAQSQSLAYLDTLMLLDFTMIPEIIMETFSIMDLVFYAIAIYEGYKFSFRPIPENIKEDADFSPAYSSLRLPIVLACFVTISLSVFFLTRGIEGEYKYYYENGNLQAIANYDNGIESGDWFWYYESGELMRSGTYQNGLAHDTWLNYNEYGILTDSSYYVLGRQEGQAKLYYDNGQLARIGQFNRDRQVGKWMFYYENGILSATGTFNDGQLDGTWKYMNEEGRPLQEIEYNMGEVTNYSNVWDNSGNQIVTNGNGQLNYYHPDGTISEKGQVVDGQRVGKLETFYVDGSKCEVGEIKDNLFYLDQFWSETGEELIKGGNGEYTSYYEGTSDLYEKGLIVDGLREGYWITYFPGGIIMQQETEYHLGQVNGRTIVYFENGNMASEGNFENRNQIGDWKWYYESGALHSTAFFVNGLKDGDQIFYSESGIKAKKETYENGELISESLL